MRDVGKRTRLALISRTDEIPKHAFGITINQNMVVVDGRILSGPQLRYKNNTTVSPRNASWNLSGRVFFKSASTPSWTLLRIGAAAKTDLSIQLTVLTDVFKKHGLKISMTNDYPGPTVDIPRATNDDLSIHRSAIDRSLEKIFREYKQKGIAMFLVILPSEDPWLFDRIKFWGEVRFGIAP